MSKQLTFLVVPLIALSVYGELIQAGTPIEVDRGMRADWKGSKLARDATEEEIAEYYADQGDDESGALSVEIAAQKQTHAQMSAKLGELMDEIKPLQDRKIELTGDLDALESDLEKFGLQRQELQAEIEQLTADRDELQAAAAKEASAQPATKGKAAK